MENKAFEFWKQKAGDKKHEIHCSAVIEACLGMIKNTDLEPEIFIIAGWIHDLGKLTDKENHHIESLKFLEEFLKENSGCRKWEKELIDCVKNHRTRGNPETTYGLVFKTADKVALRNKGWLEYKG